MHKCRGFDQNTARCHLGRGAALLGCFWLGVFPAIAWAGQPPERAYGRGGKTGSPGSGTRSAPATRPRPAGLSSQGLDALVAEELNRLELPAGVPLEDLEFLRRVYLDVAGHIPPAHRIEPFLKDSHPRKRYRLIEDLLAAPEYSQHWGRFWCDVVTYRTRGEDDHLKVDVLADWFAEQLARQVAWNEVVQQLITATGRNDRSGPPNFILAQMARPEDLAAETSRVFLGVQIQCAQCHDDPNGVWTRQQFHELAAFFGRLDEQRVDTGKEPPVAVGLKPPTPPFEVVALDQVRREYMLPDKDNPAQATPLLRPRALSGPAMPSGLSDAQRRAILATWVTGPNNMWFPRAYVNRIWAQLLGSGFTDSVDDMGPDRPVSCPKVLYRVASAWRTSNYDTRWLMTLLLNSQSYQRKAPTAVSSGPASLAGVPPRRLQPRQILQSLAVALEFDMRRLPEEFCARFERTFEFDLSTPADQLSPTISQALLLMNDVQVQELIDAEGSELIARLAESGDEVNAVESLYLHTLSRFPTPRELDVCRIHLAEARARDEGLKDILWSLINCTEFQMNR
jgi:hypothetical protein